MQGQFGQLLCCGAHDFSATAAHAIQRYILVRVSCHKLLSGGHTGCVSPFSDQFWRSVIDSSMDEPVHEHTQRCHTLDMQGFEINGKGDPLDDGEEVHCTCPAI
jgi:hypothetical protein